MWWYEGEDRDVFFDNKTSSGNSTVTSSPSIFNNKSPPPSSSNSTHTPPELRSYIGDTQDPPFHPSRSSSGTGTTRRSSGTASKHTNNNCHSKLPSCQQPHIEPEESRPSLFVAITRLLFRTASRRKPSRDRRRSQRSQAASDDSSSDSSNGRGRVRNQVSGTNSSGTGAGITIPDLSQIHYVWQLGEHNQKEQMLQRQAELRQLDLAQDENLLIEWFALIQQLDRVVRKEALSKGYRPRSHSLPPQPSNMSKQRTSATDTDENGPDASRPARVGSGDAHQSKNRREGSASRKTSKSATRRPRSNTIQGTPGGSWQPTNTSGSLPRFTAHKADPAVLTSMRDKLRAKEEELSRVRAELRRAVNEQHLDDVHQKWNANDPLQAGMPRRSREPTAAGATRTAHAIPMTPYRMRSVTVTRDEHGSFGIQVKPTKGKAYGVVRISGVKDTRRAHGLQVGDVLFEVDGHYLLTSTYDDVVSIIRNAGDFATFVVASANDVDAIHGSEFAAQQPAPATPPTAPTATPTVHCTPPHTPPHTHHSPPDRKPQQQRQRSAMHCPQTPHDGGEDTTGAHTGNGAQRAHRHRGDNVRSRSRERKSSRVHREFTIRPTSTSGTAAHGS
eukprot:m.142977 g.142977  ORF g.142977 m.142977 type:complete len:616 (+) comp17681_c0_seq1:465-2312(+)